MVDFGMPDLPGFAPPSHSKITLVPTAQGIKAFEISFGASLPISTWPWSLRTHSAEIRIFSTRSTTG